MKLTKLLSRLRLLSSIIIISICLTSLTACDDGSSDDSSGGGSGGGGSVDLTSSSDSFGVTRDVGSSSQLTQIQSTQASSKKEPNQKSITISNNSATGVTGLKVTKKGLEDITFSGTCTTQSTLPADSTCTLTAKADGKAKGSGSVTVSGDNTDGKTISASVKSPYLVASGTTATSPTSDDSPLLINITNAGSSELMFLKSSPEIPDSSKMSVDSDYTKGKNNCFNDNNTQTTPFGEAVAIEAGKTCELPVSVPQGSTGHAQVEIAKGNFFQPQYIPVNVSPALITYKDNVVSLIAGGSATVTLQRSSQDKSEFNVTNLQGTLDNSNLNTLFGSKRTFGGSSTSLEGDITSSMTGDFLMSLSGDNIANNSQPLPVDVDSNLSTFELEIKPIPKQNLAEDKQTPGFVKVEMTSKGNFSSDPVIDSVKNLDFSTSQPFKGDTIGQCEKALANNNMCTVWLEPTAQVAKTNQTGSFDITYTPKGGSSTTKTVKFDVNDELVAGGDVQINPGISSTQNLKLAAAPDVDNSSIMSWDGSQWHWQQGGNINGSTFRNITRLAINARNQVCAAGKVQLNAEGGYRSFACFNGYRWLENTNGLPTTANQGNFAALIHMPKKDSDFGSDLSDALLALNGDKPKKLYYLTADATNAGNSPTQWQSFDVPQGLSLNNVIASGVTGKLYGAVSTNNSKAKVYEITAKQGDSNTTSASIIGDAINMKKALELNPRYLLAFAPGGNNSNNKLYVGGQKDGKPIVYRNTQDGSNNWQSWQSLGSPDQKGEITSLQYDPSKQIPVITMYNNDQGDRGYVYEYKNGQWQQINNTTYPVFDYVNRGSGGQYIATSKIAISKKAIKNDTLIEPGRLLSKQSIVNQSNQNNQWARVGTKTKNGEINSLVVQPHITISSITES